MIHTSNSIVLIASNDTTLQFIEIKTEIELTVTISYSSPYIESQKSIIIVDGTQVHLLNIFL